MRDRRVEAGDCSRDDRIHGESHAARSTVMASGIISCHSAVQPRAQKSLGGLSFHSRLRTRIYETGLRLARSAARCFLSTWGILLVPVATARWTTTSKDASWWVRCRLYYLPTVHFRHGTRAGGRRLPTIGRRNY